MTKAGRQATGALAVAVAMTVGGRQAGQDASVVVTDPSERTSTRRPCIARILIVAGHCHPYLSCVPPRRPHHPPTGSE